MTIVLLDSGPLGLLTNLNNTADALACKAWESSLQSRGVTIAVSEMIDYEIQRELLRAGKISGLRSLDAYLTTVTFIRHTIDVTRQATIFWARMRQQGMPTADAKALDFDMFLAAQAAVLTDAIEPTIIATMNLKHLAPLVPTRHWQPTAAWNDVV